MREDFPQRVKQVLAARVGFRCSNPDCRASTTGPVTDPHRSSNIGEAAHITAASPGGPRFDAGLPSRDRRSARNGIWLCRTCARVVDEDTERYTRDVLRFWKMDAEELAAREKGRAEQPALPIRFAVIRLDSRCMWFPAHRLQKVAARLGCRPPIGFHEVPERAWPEFGISPQTHSLDPVFDLTFANDTTSTAVISAVGFEPYMVWAELKGIPAAYKVTKIGDYAIGVTPITPDQPQMLELGDPIAVPPAGTGRFSLRLSRFREHLPGNECLLRLCVVANSEVWRSQLVYLGVY
jgi:hypothetical protein